MTLIGSSSTAPSATDAEQFLHRWTATLPERLAWFREQVPAELSGTGLDDFDALLSFVAGARSSERVAVADPPLWWTGGFRDQFTAYGAALADGLVAAIADVVQRSTGAQWHLGEDRKEDVYRQPVLVPVAAPPWQQVFTGIARLQGGGPRRPVSLRTAVELTLAAAEPQIAGDEPLDVSAEVFVSTHPDWDLRVALTEGASEVLPSAVYMGFEDLLRSVPGVVDAMGEDREEFLVRTDRSLDPAVLEERVNALLQG